MSEVIPVPASTEAPDDGIQLRLAEAADVPVLLDLIRALARFEREPEAVKATEADLLRDGFGAHPRFEALLAELDGQAVGMALFFPTYSTWEGRPALYLEDLYVSERARGTGLGRRLMARLAKLAVERDWTRLELSVLDWNPARGFYAALGMHHKVEWLGYRLSGAGLERLAAEDR